MGYSAQSYEFRRLRLIAAEVRGERVLDIGHAQLPNPYLDGARCTGLDLRAAERCPYAEQVVGDVRDLERLLGDRKFDTIIAAEFIEHVEEPYAILRNFRALLAPGGQLILSTPNPVAFPTLLLEWAVSRRFFYTAEHTYYFAPRWMIRTLEDTGFRVERLKAVGLWPFGFVPVPVGLSYQVIYVATASGAAEHDDDASAAGDDVERD